MQVCAIDFVFHSFLNTNSDVVESVLQHGLRPLSDFPDSERWQQIAAQMPGFFENLYDQIARPVIQKPYLNSGIFVSPIDFQRLPGSLIHNKTRVKIPVARIDPDYAVLTYVLDDQRVSLPLTGEHLQEVAALWTAEMVTEWFARDRSKMFFHVPQIAVYQPGGIPVEAADVEQFVIL